MNSPKRIDRKLFLTFSLSSTAAFALGCSSDPEGAPAMGGAGGAAAGGAPPSAGSGGSNAGAAGSSAGSGGANAGSAGSSAGSGGSNTAGSGGASAGSGGAPAAGNCGTQLKTLITSNHGHTLLVTAADVMAGVTKVYDTKGASNHEHWIQLTAADFSKLASGGTVRKLSCNDGHEHEYIVNCINVENPSTTGGIANYCDAAMKCADSNTNFCGPVPG